MKRHVIIIGAGIIGASIAYHLSQLGMRVTIIDADGPAAGASGSSDGAVSIATKPPGCLMGLALQSKAYYSELSQPSAPLNNAYFECSTFLVATNDAEIEILSIQAEGLQHASVDVRTLEGDALRAVLPELQQDVPLVLEIRNEGHALGYCVVKRFLDACDANVIRRTAVTGLQIATGSGRCTGVRVGDDLITADDVVVAAGLGSTQLVVGIDIKPQRGQLVVTDRSTLNARFPGPLFFASYLAAKSGNAESDDLQTGVPSGAALVIDPLRSGQFLIGSTREDSDDVGHTEFLAVQHILKQSIRFVPGLAEVDVIRVFAGIRARPSDGFPIVGAVPGADGLWIATGFAGDGICLAPLVGRELGRLIAGGEMLAEFDDLSPSRFSMIGAGV